MEDKLLSKLDSIETLLREQHVQSKEIFNVKEAADFLDLEVGYLYQLTSKREIPFYRPGRKIYFKRQELEDWITSKRMATKSEVFQQASRYLDANPFPMQKKGGKV